MKRLLAALSLLAVSSLAHAEGDRTLVVVESDNPHVVLESRARGDRDWQVVCTGKCGRVLPLGADYRLTGPGLRDSSSFRLQPTGDRAILGVDARYSAAHTTGVVMTAVGGTVLAATIATLVFLAALPKGGDGYGLGGGAIVAMFVLPAGSVIGLSTLIPGLVLMLHNDSTRVAQASVAERAEPMFRALPRFASGPEIRIPLVSFAF